MGYECPTNFNPCDYVMTLCEGEDLCECEKKGLFKNNAVAEHLDDEGDSGFEGELEAVTMV